MTITEKQKRFLRQHAHSLRPVVIIGNAGLTEAVLKEIAVALEAHELIKVRVNAEDRDARKQMITELVTQSGAALVQTIGHIAVIYRPAEKPRLQLP